MYFSVGSFRSVGIAFAAAGAVLGMSSAASAQTMAYSQTYAPRYQPSIFDSLQSSAAQRAYASAPAQRAYASAPAQVQPYESVVPEPAETAAQVPANLRKQIV